MIVNHIIVVLSFKSGQKNIVSEIEANYVFVYRAITIHSVMLACRVSDTLHRATQFIQFQWLDGVECVIP